MKFIFKIAVVVLLSTIAGAQLTASPAEVRKVDLVTQGDEVRIEILLSAPVSAKVVQSRGTHELEVVMPGAIPAADLQKTFASGSGVKSIRMERQRENPSSTRVAVVLDQPRPYGLAVEGNKVTLRILPALAAKSGQHRQAPVPAAKNGWGNLSRRKQDATLPNSSETQSAELTPPPSTPALVFPESSSVTTTESKSAGSFDAANSVSQPASPIQSQPTDTAAASASASVATSAEPNPAVQLSQPNADIRIAFKVKYVIQGVAYLEGGRSSGLAEGIKLFVKDTDPTTGRPLESADGEQKAVAELRVFAIAETSAATEIHDPTREVKPGDWAFLSPEETAALVAQRSLSATRKYPVVVSFTEENPLDEEARAEVPRPPLPEVNRSRGRIGLDYTGFVSHGSSAGSSSSLGLVVRTDITRINGTYWNLSGYWRGRINSRSSTGQATIQDLINRTYHLQMTYDNPQSNWVAGFGRLYLPWATSLDTIDGGYFGWRPSQGTIVGTFGGSTPDPTSWSYAPNRHLMGGFFNAQGGSFDDIRYSSTSGMGVSMMGWSIDRPFVFFENQVSYKRYLSLYHSLQADSPRGNAAVAAPGAGIGRSFLTLRVQPVERVDFNLNHTYFRDIPAFDPQLIGTGLLDKYLFQGFSAGVRVEVAQRIWVYTNLGRSNRSGDAKSSLNQMYGVTFGHVPWVGMSADFRYSKFDSSFGGGSYKALSLTRNFRENFRWELLAGSQSFASSASKNMSSHFFTGNLEANLGSNYFVQSGYTRNRGGLQNYDQWTFTFGYRFDSKAKGSR